MKTDARVRYTKMRIREAFLRLLKEKPVNKISVKELCELAEINRATFYIHYSDPFDLLEKLEVEVLQGLQQFLNNRLQGGEVLLSAVLTEVRAEADPVAILSSSNGDPSFSAKITELFRATFLPVVAELLPNVADDRQITAYRFLAGGCGGVIAQWMENGMHLPPEKLAEELTRLGSAFVTAYRDQLDSIS